MLRRILLSIFLTLTIYINLISQTAKDSTWSDNSRRYSFSKTYFGIDFNYFDSYDKSQYLKEDGTIASFSRSNFLTPSVNIGGIHFWGHADFYVSFATASFKQKSDDINSNFKLNVLTGAKYYPWAITENKIRPFVNYAFGPAAYTQYTYDQKQKLNVTKIKSIFGMGLSYRTKHMYLYASYNYISNSKKQNFAISRTQDILTTFPSQYFNLGLNYTWEVTKYAKKPIYYELNKIFEKSNKKGIFLAVGPSAAFSTSNSKYNAAEHQFLIGQGNNPTFADVALGYDFSKIDANIALSYRKYSRIREGYNFKQTTIRSSLVLESYKFLFDYKGFVPFVGVGISYDMIKVKETDSLINTLDASSTSFNPIIVFGWDIRPSRKGDWWLLRTNLRYTPSLKIQIMNSSHFLNDIEFNFIQYVFYPQRFLTYRKIKSKL